MNAILKGASLSAMMAQITAFNGPEPTPNPDLSDPKAIIAKIEGLMTQMRVENDAALKGKANSDTVDNMNTEITALKAALETAQKAAQRALIGGAGGGEGAELAQNAARFMTLARGKRAAVGDAADIEAYQEYRSAFDTLVRREGNVDNIAPEIRNALSVGSDPKGGYFVPTEVSTEMVQRIFDTSPMRQISSVTTIGTGAWMAPYKTSKGTSGGWVGERSARPSTDTPTVGTQRIEVHEQYAYPEITQDMLDDASLDIEGWLVQETQDEMGRVENTAFVGGDGVMKPKGFLAYKDSAVTTTDKAGRAWGKLQYIPMGDAGAFPSLTNGAANANCLINAITALHPNYRAGARWTMNRTVEAEIRKLKDAEGRYLIGMSQIEGALQFDIHGFPITNLEDMPDLGADSFSIAFGNFQQGYKIIDRSGFRLLRDPYTNKPYVGFYIVKRTGGDVRNFDAIKLIKAAAA
ncbi:MULTISPECIES: phage major capsid protein [Thalassospira]|uniref:phage major capsid protein n=1 Tax=Thalassospira TaxID=168934 RepID=UPI0008DE21A1|nr:MULTISPECIES: phage major capsid protein [Thalassospira]MDM7975226.1 phage major capsid protein [Thalassospira xiamenensis]OHZ00992.1 hypothetical protein BC440_09130 [Thalassospira sp. MIT1004]